MTEQTNKAVKERKISKSVIITGVIWLITLIVMGVFAIIEKTPDMVVTATTWNWIVMPLALVAFVLCLLWNNTQEAKQMTVKTIATVVVLFFAMFYLMFAVLMVWIAKVDNTPEALESGASQESSLAADAEQWYFEEV